jgi:hypothetical protein
MALVGYLFELGGVPMELDALWATPMQDGGMGNLAIAPLGRRFGSAAAECHFYDSDAALASAVLNVDSAGDPLEIDVWRVDFDPLVCWPSRTEIRAGPPNNSSKCTALRSGLTPVLGVLKVFQTTARRANYEKVTVRNINRSYSHFRIAVSDFSTL